MADTNFSAVVADTFTGALVGGVTGDVTGDVTGVFKGTPQSITSAGTIDNSAAFININSTTARAITWTNPTKIGSTYRIFNLAAPSSGTHTITLSAAGTLHWQGTAGSIINFTLAYQAVTVCVVATGNFIVMDNVGTVTLA